MDTNPIHTDEYLTEDEDNSEDEEYFNFYKFISSESRKNIALRIYLFDIGWFEKNDTIYLDMVLIQDIYDLLDEKTKKIINDNYLRDIRKITNNIHFTPINNNNNNNNN
jgi:hypothetical protein